MKAQIFVVCYLLAGCAQTSTMPLAGDTLQITTSAAPVCNAAGAQGTAIRHAAAETIKAGFDRFIVLNQQASNTVRVVGYTPVSATTNSEATFSSLGGGYTTAHGTSTTNFGGGFPIMAGHHNQSLIIKMFHDQDPAGANAVAARAFLGPNWQTAVGERGMGTCL